jgi:hypothetical protein
MSIFHFETFSLVRTVISDGFVNKELLVLAKTLICSIEISSRSCPKPSYSKDFSFIGGAFFSSTLLAITKPTIIVVIVPNPKTVSEVILNIFHFQPIIYQLILWLQFLALKLLA